MDRAALDFAIAQRIAHGGWCPSGRWAEDGSIGEQYELRETPSPEPAQRTGWNVRDSDGTVIFSISPILKGGSAETVTFAHLFNRPLLHLCFEREQRPAELLAEFIRRHRIETLNVAGPRQSEEPRAGLFAKQVLTAAIEALSCQDHSDHPGDGNQAAND